MITNKRDKIINREKKTILITQYFNQIGVIFFKKIIEMDKF